MGASKRRFLMLCCFCVYVCTLTKFISNLDKLDKCVGFSFFLHLATAFYQKDQQLCLAQYIYLQRRSSCLFSW
uniref:Uncharacterized protein n=1 Tax=Anguilla anguilla TaxID=7936 RepID=A0A0E9WED1_ANGAN